MFRFFLLVFFLFSSPSLATQREEILYKITEIKKDALNDSIKSIPLLGDILKKDDINGQLVYVRNDSHNTIVKLKSKELSFKSSKIFNFFFLVLLCHCWDS